MYSYGVVLLELLTGRKSLDKSRPVREQTLADWALPRLTEKKKLLGIIDPRLETETTPSKGCTRRLCSPTTASTATQRRGP